VRFTTYVDALTWLESHVDYELVAPNRREVPTLQPLVEPWRCSRSAARLPHDSRHGPTEKARRRPHQRSLECDGLRVGASPVRPARRERTNAINSEPIDDEELITLLSDWPTSSPSVALPHEVRTVDRAAFLHFSDEGVDVAVIEVGWAVLGIRRTSSTASSPYSPTSTWITPRYWARRSRRSRATSRHLSRDAIAIVATTTPLSSRSPTRAVELGADSLGLGGPSRWSRTIALAAARSPYVPLHALRRAARLHFTASTKA